jgi:hypothetical protein
VKAQLTTAAPITWSDGELFNGYILLILSPPTGAGAPFVLSGTGMAIAVPLRFFVRIVDGVIQSQDKIWRTDSLQPPGARYSCFWYAWTTSLLASEPTLFAVEADEYTITPPTLTALTPEVTEPTP